MDQARTEIEAQKAKWMPNYDKAKELLNTAKTQADAAAEASVAARSGRRPRRSRRSPTREPMVEGAEPALKTAPKGKGTKADLEMMQKDIDGYKQSIADAEGLISSEDYMGARDKAKAAMDGAKNVQDQIVAAGGKVPEMKPADAAMTPPPAPRGDATTVTRLRTASCDSAVAGAIRQPRFVLRFSVRPARCRTARKIHYS
jgi:hypothetical protein